MKLFWKLFLILLLAMLGAATVSSWLSHRWLLESQQISRRLDALGGLGEKAANLYLERGPRSLDAWLTRNMPKQHAEAFLLDADGFNLLPHFVPSELDAFISDALSGQGPKRLIDPPDMLLVRPLVAGGETFYWVVHARIPPEAMRERRTQALLLRLLLAAVALLLVSWLLSRIFVRPIQGLQQAALQLGRGDMQTRAPEGISDRGDEIGELARTFDGMAAQLAQLMGSHKQLLRDISHELRSPLARLEVALELARNAAGDAAVQELDRIALEAGRLNDLIGEVLALARFEQGAVVLRREEVQMDALLREIVADAAFEAETVGKSVRMKDDAPLLMLRGDRLWLARALDNVIRNALRHTPDGASVDICARKQADALAIEVRDHGAGADEASLPHLFEPFFRADSRRERGRERTTGGYGLGLAIARQVIEAHEGDIRAENARDGGLLVRISLPLS